MKNYIEIWNHGGRFSRCRADRPPLTLPHSQSTSRSPTTASHYYVYYLWLRRISLLLLHVNILRFISLSSSPCSRRARSVLCIAAHSVLSSLSYLILNHLKYVHSALHVVYLSHSFQLLTLDLRCTCFLCYVSLLVII